MGYKYPPDSSPIFHESLSRSEISPIRDEIIHLALPEESSRKTRLERIDRREQLFSVHEMRPEDIGILAFRGDPDKQPFMVGYFKSSGIRESKVRQKRDARRRKKSESSSLDYRNNPYTGKCERGNGRDRSSEFIRSSTSREIRFSRPVFNREEKGGNICKIRRVLIIGLTILTDRFALI